MNTPGDVIKSRLNFIIDAINDEICDMNEVAENLRQHADRMYGPTLAKEADTAKAFPESGLGSLEKALADLKEVNGRVAYEAGRNTTFA